MFAKLFLTTVIGEDHLLALRITLEDHIGVQHVAELPQEVEGVVPKLLRRKQHHQHQRACRQPLRHMLCTVQPVPLTLGTVAALVTVAITEVILAVLVIEGAKGRKDTLSSIPACGPQPHPAWARPGKCAWYTQWTGVDTGFTFLVFRLVLPSSLPEPWGSEATQPYLLALSLSELAVEAIKEAASRVALAVAVAVTEVFPALQGLCAVLPGVVEVEGTVPTVPATRVIVTLQVADLVACTLLALGQLAGLLNLWRGDVAPSATREAVVQDVAQQPIEFGRAQTAVERTLRGGLTGPLIVAGIATHTGAAGRELALGAGEGAQAQAGGTAWA